ncbi:tyrosine-type recombinase/integrase [Rhodanobacter glycinis]|uniref:Tyrosine-type recombinase/integrase n=1 Tax=Rhodanobacter glycinis TaxID=582702 RepID=A0A5B9E7D5_9GAMM|nr:tyrosine-type recombinase/integrase [Rhodanobacter glycinis]QEE26381.1 tyrosine-type recombinase/integrase [Rhodanobacter glycinis]
MGRKPKRPDAIPRLRVRKKPSGTIFYYYDHGGKPRHEEPLGSDYGLAIKRWAEIERADSEKPASVITFRYVADRYRAIVIPTKAPRTQLDNAKELKQLLAFFDDPPCPLEAIEPQHVRQYIAWRSQTAKIRANREKALLSHIWNWARGEGYTALANPCAGIRGNKETGRDVYIEDDVFAAVWKLASGPLRDAMDLAYLTGQRVADTLRMDQRDMRDGFLHVKQGKTGTKRRIEVTGDLAALVERIASRKSRYVVHATRLIVGDDGQPIPYDRLRRSFRDTCTLAGIDADAFQFRDLRAKAGTDKADSAGDIREAQHQLGHANLAMTEHYVRNRRGAKVTPTR